MKTPIQQAIDKLVERYNETSSEMQEAAYAIAIMDLRSLILIEKEVIAEAFKEGEENILKDEREGCPQYDSGQDYFTTKFISNEN
jgi:pyruvate/2-oxoglutarate/acetoin dehydrogenase E1 component